MSIVTNEKYLRQKSAETTLDECLSPCFNLIAQLENELANSGGLGLSAIQIGYPLQVCIIKAKLNKPIIMINPKIEKQSEPIRVQGEGCLSFPGLYLDTWRYQHTVANWIDEKGNFNRAVFTGLEAVVVQHELDHFLGVLFTDRSLE